MKKHERGGLFLYTDIAAVTRNQEQFYKALFNGCKDYVEIRLINEGKPKTIFLTIPELMNYPTPLDTNVYVGIFQRGIKGNGKTESCSITNAIYLDFDDMELTEIHYRIDQGGFPQPSMIVDSGHGYHVYWLLDKPASHEIKPLLDELVDVLHADFKAKDIARVFRVPDTMNVKDEPVPSKLVEINDNRTNLQTFENILGVKAQKEPIKRAGLINELVEIPFNGLYNMANGVKKGERNFCIGRIVQTLKRLNYTKKETSDIIFKWNTLNNPKKSNNELKQEINTFWHDDRYKYDGKEFMDSKLQELNDSFIDGDTTFFKPADTNYGQYDNELLHPERFKNIGGLTFAMLSIIKLKKDKGIRREHLADLCSRDKTDRKLTSGLKTLEELGYIEIKKQDKTFFYYYKEKPNFKRGFTSVPSLLDESYLGKRITENEYKLMIILESYAFDNKREVFPSNRELAYRMGVTEKTIKTNLTKLKHKIYIDTEFKKGNRYIILLRSR